MGFNYYKYRIMKKMLFLLVLLPLIFAGCSNDSDDGLTNPLVGTTWECEYEMKYMYDGDEFGWIYVEYRRIIFGTDKINGYAKSSSRFFSNGLFPNEYESEAEGMFYFEYSYNHPNILAYGEDETVSFTVNDDFTKLIEKFDVEEGYQTSWDGSYNRIK